MRKAAGPTGCSGPLLFLQFPCSMRYRTQRDFGLVVGGVFALLSLWWIYRGKLTEVVLVTLPIGVVLIALGLVWPRALVLPHKAWMWLAEVLSFISTRIILALVFFLIVTPIGLVKRLSGWDPLSRRAPKRGSYWQTYSDRQRDPRHYEKMF
jgi:apolipoprotein N-acyltransferase